MSDSTPSVYDLNKVDDIDDEAGEHYPEDIEDETPQSGANGYNFDHDTEVMEELKEAGLTEKLALSFKMTDDEFTDVSLDDTILFDTPVEGAKAGEVVEMSNTWSGITSVKVDTGVSKYDITPLKDEFSAEYVGKVADTVSLTQDVLKELEAATVDSVSKGDSVVLDCPHLGATVGKVVDIKQTENQGKRATFKSEGVYFVTYEKPSPIQTKEQPYLVGRRRD
jgi:hypothetical protein